MQDWRRYKLAREAGIARPRVVDSIGTVRRLRGLHAAGRTWKEIAAKIGGAGETWVGRVAAGDQARVYVTTAETVRDLAESAWAWEPGTSVKARRRAQRLGWAPLAAWDDIDDPGEDPATVTAATDDEPDPMAAVVLLNRRGAWHHMSTADRGHALSVIRQQMTWADLANRIDVDAAELRRTWSSLLVKQARTSQKEKSAPFAASSDVA